MNTIESVRIRAYRRIIPLIAAAFVVAVVSKAHFGIELRFDAWIFPAMAIMFFGLWYAVLSGRVALRTLDYAVVGGLGLFFLSRLAYAVWFAQDLQWWKMPTFVLYLPGFLALIFWVFPRDRASRAAWGFIVLFLAVGAPRMLEIAFSTDEQARIVAYMYLHIPIAAGIVISLLRAYGAKEAIQQQNVAAAVRQSQLDPLTRLENRRGMAQHLHACSDAFTRQGTPFSLILADIDDFKQVNDTYGHNVGDEALSNVARILRDEVRGSDIVCRLGGDEFAIVLPRTSLFDANALADRLRTEIRDAVHPSGAQVTLSLGVAEFHRGEPLDNLMERADGALYAAKRLGRDRTHSVDALELESPAVA